jgi:hypothetical protein
VPGPLPRYVGLSSMVRLGLCRTRPVPFGHQRDTDRVVSKDGNGYPLPETRWIFAILGYEFGSISLLMGLLMGSNGNPTGTWA